MFIFLNGCDPKCTENSIYLEIKFYRIYLLFMQSSISGTHKVFVIHGLGGFRLIMKRIFKSLINENYIAENYRYKSMTKDLNTLGKQLYGKIKESNCDTVSFVTHSMGALVVRLMLQYSMNDGNFPLIYRIVMIAPPNSGSELADFYYSFKILRKLLGPRLEHMITDSGSLANRLPVPVNSEIGIIAGHSGKRRLYNPFIKEDNDGVLTPKRTRLGVEKDFIIIKGSHSLITQKKHVCNLVVEFLKFGCFKSKLK